MIWVCKTILSDGLDKCYFLQKNVEVLITPTIILEPQESFKEKYQVVLRFFK